WEPYTGRQPSPSPDYPQEIVNAGKYNEDTQKWEYEVKLRGKNLLKFPYIDGSSKTDYGITFTANNDGSVTVSGTNSGESTSFFNLMIMDSFMYDNIKNLVFSIPNSGTV